MWTAIRVQARIDDRCPDRSCPLANLLNFLTSWRGLRYRVGVWCYNALVPYDAAAEALLHDVIDDWASRGILGTLRSVVDEVWPRNLDRYEPDLGDDRMVLGVQSSRNVRNLAVRLLENNGVEASVVDHSLQVKYAGRVLHIGKARSSASTWDVDSQRWDDSEVRLSGAKANSRAYLPSDGALFPVRAGDPVALRYLHMTWQGLDNNATRAWVGFPRDGDIPWFAVAPLAAADPLSLPSATTGPVLPPSPNFDDIESPQPEIKIKRQGKDQGGQASSSGEQS